VLWVQNARRDHFDFIDKLRDRDVEVVELRARESTGVTEYLMPPLPNTLYTRDTHLLDL